MIRVAAVMAVAVLAFVPTSSGAASSTAGDLPQTNAKPGMTTGLTSPMAVLWRAITSDSASVGQTVFFPRAAYIQMKTGAIVNPSGDYTSRLLAFFDLDLTAYHRLLSSPTTALVRVSANPLDASWIAPGACENRIGYWHLAGVRLVVRRGGRIQSVEVASLISWRGVWYVVHLGPNPRPSDVGTVDDFENGPGVPGPGGGC